MPVRLWEEKYGAAWSEANRNFIGCEVGEKALAIEFQTLITIWQYLPQLGGCALERERLHAWCLRA